MSRYLILAALFGAVMYGDDIILPPGAVKYGEDITLPLGNGNVLISAKFIRVNQYGSYVPELSLKLENRTSTPWRTLQVQFDIGGLCKGEPRHWTVPVVTSLGWAEDHPVVKEYRDTVIPLVGEVEGCTAEIIKASIDGSAPISFTKELLQIKDKRDLEAAAQAERDRLAAEERAKKVAAEIEQERIAEREQAKKDNAQAERRKQLAAEQRRKADELKAAEDAVAAEERKRTREACSAIYKSTADKKISNLTVKEEQQVRACQALGIYAP